MAPSSCKLKAAIGLFERWACRALADKESGKEVVINLRSVSKYAPTQAAKDRRHATKGGVIDTKDVARLGEEGERLDSK